MTCWPPAPGKGDFAPPAASPGNKPSTLEAHIIQSRRVIRHPSTGIRRRAIVAVQIAAQHSQHRHLLPPMMRSVWVKCRAKSREPAIVVF